MIDKTYRTVAQLIDILRSRGMVIEDGAPHDTAMRILETENYYNIVNGYKDLFLSPASAPSQEHYRNGTTFEELYALYQFDRDIRHIYLKYLLKVENTFKSVLAHEFSALYGHDNYLKLENFDAVPDNISSIIKLFGDIQQETARQMSKHHQAVTHYLSEYGYIPLWVLVNVLPFGKVTMFYKLMKPQDKQNIARKFHVDAKELHKYMSLCGLARNQCAHDERFFDLKFRWHLHTRSIANFSCLGLERDKSGSYPSGTNDVSAIGIVFARLLGTADTAEFIASMSAAFSKLEQQLHTISIKDVMRIMGYPAAWERLQQLAR